MTAGPTAPSYGWRVGSLRGVPVFIGRSYPLIALVVVGLTAFRVPDPRTGQTGGLYGVAVGVASALLLLVSVLVHEGAHAVVAARLGHRVDRIVADVWGGHTVYDGGVARPGSSAAIAVSGPVANLVVAGLAYAARGPVGDGTPGLLLSYLFLGNLLLGVVNLLPGLPLDGGFVVDSLVWKVTGSRHVGLLVAGWLGRLLVVAAVLLLVGLPLLRGASPAPFTVVYVALIGAFLWNGATAAVRAGGNGRAMERVPVGQVLRPVASAGVHEPLGQVLARLDGFPGAVVVHAPDGRPAGLLDREAAHAVHPADLTAGLTTAAVLLRQPPGWAVVVDPAADSAVLVDAVVSAGGGPDDPVPALVVVLDPSGRPVGSVSLSELDAAVRARR
ncbi:M50 family metallopeptidase [Lapillicoccus jejuensis]|uniref:Zn-dependent protease n=1 Tax=Lapillicoccus jejuensis TaxID=402171 RepID=A0A542E4T3_9MICO|nr:site-2 protease family protein [Lapillicoccus jejuensis]TQJ10299.1 Zn-dependent protease [Lapillicoccus jejuensis]